MGGGARQPFAAVPCIISNLQTAGSGENLRPGRERERGYVSKSECAPGINAAVAELWWYYCESQMIEILRLPAVLLLLAKWLSAGGYALNLRICEME